MLYFRDDASEAKFQTPYTLKFYLNYSEALKNQIDKCCSNSWKHAKHRSEAQAYIGCMKSGPVLAHKKVPLLTIAVVFSLIFLTPHQMPYFP